MRIRMDVRLFLPIVVAVISICAAAQQPTIAPKPAAQRVRALEFTYDYIHSNGPPHACGCFGLNGGSAEYAHPLGRTSFDLVGNLTGAYAGGISASNLGITLITYTVGARYSPQWKYASWHPYGEITAGGAHASGDYVDAQSVTNLNKHAAFAGTIGGGVDVKLNPRLSLKIVDLRYLVTTFPNGDTDHQNNLQVGFGLSIKCAKSHK
jgi:hypothetical protein